MEEKVKELKEKLDKETLLKEELATKREEFEKSNESLINEIKGLSENIESIKEDISGVALQKFELDGNKKMYAGVGIRVMKDVSYDKDAAFKWAKEHKLCLKLDDTAFKKIAKSQDIDFVEIKERSIVTFPKELVL